MPCWRHQGNWKFNHLSWFSSIYRDAICWPLLFLQGRVSRDEVFHSTCTKVLHGLTKRRSCEKCRSRGQRAFGHQSEYKQVHHQFFSVWTSELFSSSHLAPYQNLAPAPTLNGPLFFQLLSAPPESPPDSFPYFPCRPHCCLPFSPSPCWSALMHAFSICVSECAQPIHLMYTLSGHRPHLTDPTSETSTGKEPSRP